MKYNRICAIENNEKSLKNNSKKFEKTLDKTPKMAYNVYIKRNEKTIEKQEEMKNDESRKPYKIIIIK